MGDHDHRQCLNRLLSLSAEAELLDHHRVAAEIDRMLTCNGGGGCQSKLACSCLAVDLAASLAQRYR